MGLIKMNKQHTNELRVGGAIKYMNLFIVLLFIPIYLIGPLGFSVLD